MIHLTRSLTAWMFCRRLFLLLFVVVAPVLCENPVRAALVTEWSAFDATANTADGFLGGISVSLTTDLAVVRPSLGDSGVLDGVLDNTDVSFSDGSVFTPALAVSDSISLGATSEFTVTFSPAAVDPVFHISQLADNQLTFSAALTVLSKTPDLTVGATSIFGVSDADDASGSIQFMGMHTSISWTSSPAGASAFRADDGIKLQIALVPEPSILALTALALLSIGSRRRKRA